MSFLAMRKYALTISYSLLLSLFCMGYSLNTVGNFGNTLIKAASDVNIFTDAEELQFRKEFVAQHEREVRLYTDPVVTNYINDLGQSLVRHSKRNNIACTFKIVDTKWTNVYAVPGGFIYVHLDLIQTVPATDSVIF